MSQSSQPESAATRPGNLSGARLGEYQILRPLGQGGMGQVYLAEQVSLGRRVAVKVIRPEMTASPTALKRFQAEARAVARLAHPNIVQIFTISKQDGLQYIAFEFVEGASLASYMAKKGALPVDLTVAILRQVASALQHASEHGIVHRDIKPDNILLTRKAEAKVTDFGLARCTAQDAPAQGLTASGVVMGTPLYMSPEQIECKPTDARSDIYSLGVTAYHMLAGRAPYQGQSAFDTAIKHIEGKAMPLRSIRPDLPEELAIVVHKMMARAPEQRYANGKDLLKDLNRLGAVSASAIGEVTKQMSPEEMAAAPLVTTDLPSKVLGQGTSRKMRRSRHALWISASAVTAVVFVGLLLFVIAWTRNRSAHSRFGGRVTPAGLVLELDGKVEAVAFSPNGKLFATGEHEPDHGRGSLVIYDRATGNKVLERAPASIRSLAFSPDSQTLAIGGNPGSVPVRLLNMQDFSERPFGPDNCGVRTLTFSPDGKKLAIAYAYQDERTEPNEIRLLDLSTGKESATLASHTGTLFGLAFSPDGRVLASGADKVLKLRDPETGKAVHEDISVVPEDETTGICDLAFSANGKMLVVGCYGKVLVWNTTTWRSQGTVWNDGHCLALSRDGKLAVGTDEGDVALFDLATRKQLANLRGHRRVAFGDTFVGVVGMAFSPDGHTLASAGWDKTVRLWDVSGAGTPPHTGEAVDLFQVVDVRRDLLRGECRFEGTTLVTPATPSKENQWPWIKVPQLPARAYQLDMRLERKGSTGAGLGIIFVNGNNQAMAVVDAAVQPRASGIDQLDGRRCVDNSTTFHGDVLIPDKPVMLTLKVVGNAVTLTADGKTIIDWKGDPGVLSLHSDFAAPDPKALILVFESSFHVYSLTYADLTSRQ